MFQKGSFGCAEDLFAALVADISMEWPPGGANAYECILTTSLATIPLLPACKARKSSFWQSPTPNLLCLAAPSGVCKSWYSTESSCLFLSAHSGGDDGKIVNDFDGGDEIFKIELHLWKQLPPRPSAS